MNTFFRIFIAVLAVFSALATSCASARNAPPPAPLVSQVMIEVERGAVAAIASEEFPLATFLMALSNGGRAQRFTGQGGVSIYLPQGAEQLVLEYERFMNDGTFSKYSPSIAKAEYVSNFSKQEADLELVVTIRLLDAKAKLAEIQGAKTYKLKFKGSDGFTRYILAGWSKVDK
jgi:hypothetical protein